MKTLNISLIGSGRVARFLGHKFYKAGHDIQEVYSKQSEHAIRLADQLHAKPVTSLSQLTHGTDIYVVAVKDDAIKQVVLDLMFYNELVVHTSGAIEHDILKNASSSYGVFYPFQSISSFTDPVPTKSPIIIYGESEKTIKKLDSLADSIGQQSVVLNDKKRLQLHLVAVFINNFTNHLGTISADLAREGNIPFSLLHPMIDETLKHLKEDPLNFQTGPALRNDVDSMKRHIEILRNNPVYVEVYEAISKSIRASHSSNK